MTRPYEVFDLYDKQNDKCKIEDYTVEGRHRKKILT